MNRIPYVRTEETKEKQRKAMREVSKHLDYSKITKKRKKTIKERGSVVGCPKGFKRKLSGVFKPCPTCGVDVYHTLGDLKIERRKCCSRGCLMIDPVYIQKHKNVDRSYLRKHDWKRRKKTTPKYRRYKNEVHRLSEKTYVENIDLINPERNPRTLCGVDGGWQLDHIKSVRECFEDGVATKEAASVENLRLLPWKENLMRQYNGN